MIGAICRIKLCSSGWCSRHFIIHAIYVGAVVRKELLTHPGGFDSMLVCQLLGIAKQFLEISWYRLVGELYGASNARVDQIYPTVRRILIKNLCLLVHSALKWASFQTKFWVLIIGKANPHIPIRASYRIWTAGCKSNRNKEEIEGILHIMLHFQG